ncbi:hypothetical protein [Microcoleus sp. MOSTC5]|uniref:hypothetical protein n=1 Tax=Microcoleus sp. MOSTC5 TaxID=3055378 RepID=UPI002FD45BAA
MISLISTSSGRSIANKIVACGARRHRAIAALPHNYSREYSRMFGAPPIRDIERLRIA